MVGQGPPYRTASGLASQFRHCLLRRLPKGSGNSANPEFDPSEEPGHDDAAFEVMAPEYLEHDCARTTNLAVIAGLFEQLIPIPKATGPAVVSPLANPSPRSLDLSLHRLQGRRRKDAGQESGPFFRYLTFSDL